MVTILWRKFDIELVKDVPFRRFGEGKPGLGIMSNKKGTIRWSGFEYVDDMRALNVHLRRNMKWLLVFGVAHKSTQYSIIQQAVY